MVLTELERKIIAGFVITGLAVSAGVGGVLLVEQFQNASKDSPNRSSLTTREQLGKCGTVYLQGGSNGIGISQEGQACIP